MGGGGRDEATRLKFDGLGADKVVDDSRRWKEEMTLKKTEKIEKMNEFQWCLQAKSDGLDNWTV